MTSSLHFHCSLDYSSSLTCICPHHSPLPSTNNLTVCLLQNTSVIPYKPQTSSLLASLSPSYWQWHQSPALSLPSLLSFLLSSALLPPCPEPLGHLPIAPAFTPPSVRSSLSRSDWAPPPSPRYAQPPLSRALTPHVDSLPPFSLHPPEPASFSFSSSVRVLRFTLLIVCLPP